MLSHFPKIVVKKRMQLLNNKPHAGLDTSLTSTSLIQLIPSWTCFKSIIMRMAVAWIRQSPQEKKHLKTFYHQYKIFVFFCYRNKFDTLFCILVSQRFLSVCGHHRTTFFCSEIQDPGEYKCTSKYTGCSNDDFTGLEMWTVAQIHSNTSKEILRESFFWFCSIK